MRGAQPHRMAAVCGAIGPYSRARVEAIATCFEHPLEPTHESPDAMLFADRAPLAWREGERSGFSWGRALPPEGPPPRGWREAADRGDCGVELGPDGPLLHSSTPGVYPLYWLAADGAVYFASAVDPLARGAAGPLTVDWEAWAAIITCGCPQGERTPFAEIRRLLPQAWVAAGPEGPRQGSDEWPWLRFEPRLGVEEAAGPVVEALRRIAARLPDGPQPIALSGGLDSRILACLLAERGLEVTGFTSNGDSGNDSEQRAAGAVAAALRIVHEHVDGRPEDYWAEADDRGLRTDYQRLANPWLTPVHERVASFGVPVLDGLSGDILFDRSRYMRPEMLDPSTPRLAGPLWRGMRHERGVGLAGALGEALAESAREQVAAVARPLTGHPNRAVFGVYLSRVIGGVARVSLGNLGTRALVEAPFTTSEVAALTLSTSLDAKSERSLRETVIERLSPAAAGLPTNHGLPGEPVPQRRLSGPALRGFREVLADGPLAEHLDPRSWALVRGEGAPEGVRPRRLWRTIDGAVTCHLWLRRYGSLVTGVDPVAALGVAR